MGKRKKQTTPPLLSHTSAPLSTPGGGSLGSATVAPLNNVQSLAGVVASQSSPPPTTVDSPSHQALVALETSNPRLFQRIHAKSNETVNPVTVEPISASLVASTADVGGSPVADLVPPASQADASGKTSWSDMFKGSLTAKGAPLSFVVPNMVNGKAVASLDADELARG